MKKASVRNSLKRQLFYSLVGVSIVSVVLITFFWITSQTNTYKTEIETLRKTYPEDKKQEIKNKIMAILDYLEWLQYKPLPLITHELSSETGLLSIPENAKTALTNNAYDTCLQVLYDSIERLRVPISIVSDAGIVVYSFNPFHPEKKEAFSNYKSILLEQILERTNAEGIVTIYNKKHDPDSTLQAVGYYNNIKLPGFKLISMACEEELENILRVFALDSISKMRYDVNEYVFVNTLSGKALVTHGKFNNPPLDIYSSGDSLWIDIFKQQQKAALSSEGHFYSYMWPKLSSEDIAVKTSYFGLYQDWEWIIGTGYYEDDINTIIESRKNQLYTDLWTSIYKALAYLFVTFIVSSILAMYFSKRLEKNIAEFLNFFHKLSSEDQYIDLSNIYFKEFVFIADAANQMVDKRKLAESAMQESEERFRLLFENSMDAVLLTIPDGSILRANPAACQIFGRSEEDIIRLGREGIFDIHDPRFAPALEQRAETGMFFGELTGLRKDGTPFPIEISSALFQVRQGETNNSLIIRDISGRKAAEQAVQKKLSQLEHFHSLTVDRELMMIELKKEINELLIKSGQPKKY